MPPWNISANGELIGFVELGGGVLAKPPSSEPLGSLLGIVRLHSVQFLSQRVPGRLHLSALGTYVRPAPVGWPVPEYRHNQVEPMPRQQAKPRPFQ